MAQVRVRRLTGYTHKHTIRATQHTTRQEQHHKRPHEVELSLWMEKRGGEYTARNAGSWPETWDGMWLRHEGLEKGMNTTPQLPSPASRAGTDLPTNVQAVSRAVSYVNSHRPRFQVRARPSYIYCNISLELSPRRAQPVNARAGVWI